MIILMIITLIIFKDCWDRTKTEASNPP